MHLMILWNSTQTSKEMRKYLTIVNIFIYIKVEHVTVELKYVLYTRPTHLVRF
jgi:hypothetical protein